MFQPRLRNPEPNMLSEKSAYLPLNYSFIENRYSAIQNIFIQIVPPRKFYILLLQVAKPY